MSVPRSPRSFFFAAGGRQSPPSQSSQQQQQQRQQETMRLEEPLESYRAKALRKEVSRLGLKVTRSGNGANDHKSGYMELLRAHRQQQRLAGPAPQKLLMPPKPKKPKKPEPYYHGDLTFRLIDMMLSEDNWPSVHEFYKTVALKNKSMISDTATTQSFDLYGPRQSVEGSRFWWQMADAMAAIDRKSTPDALFDAWKHVCAAYNGRKLPSSREGEEEKREMMYLLSKLRTCLHLVPCTTVGSYFKTFDPIVMPPSGEGTSSSSSWCLDCFTDSTDVRSDSDSSTSDAADVAVVSDLATTDASQSTDAEDPPLLEMKREFWRYRSKLVRQQLTTARLQHGMQCAAFLEQRLSGAKRKIAALRGELSANKGAPDAQAAAAELSLYERERAQLLAALQTAAPVAPPSS